MPGDLAEQDNLRELEFIALMAFLMSNVALAIDTVLPALPTIGMAISETDPSHLQLIVIMIFLGLGLGELLFGTLSDSLGRKPVVYLGVGLFILASFMIIYAQSLEILLLGRVLQGAGLSAARSVSIAIIRDTFEGDRMARIMSFIMAVFILVPMIAPLLGQLILRAFNWQAIFYFQVLFIGLTLVWFWVRQRETLRTENRKEISRYLFTKGIREYFHQRRSVVYTMVAGLTQGAFIAYLGSAQQIFQIQYDRVEEFPYLFGVLAFAIGLSTLLNGSLVMKYGMQRLVIFSLLVSVALPLVYVLCFINRPNPSLVVLLGFLFPQFLVLGFLFGNLGALTMQPLGHIAGIGAAIFSCISMTISVIIAIVIGFFIRDTTLPLFVGFCLSNLLALVLIQSLRKGVVRSPNI